jgi:hypothetical protein
VVIWQRAITNQKSLVLKMHAGLSESLCLKLKSQIGGMQQGRCCIQMTSLILLTALSRSVQTIFVWDLSEFLNRKNLQKMHARFSCSFNQLMKLSRISLADAGPGVRR